MPVNLLRGMWALWVLLTLLCPSLLVTAQESELELGANSGFEVRLSTLWQRYKAAKKRGDDKAAKAAFKEIEDGASAEIFELGGYLFLAEGYEELEAGNYEQARNEFHNALNLSPYLWPAYEGLGLVKLRGGSGAGALIGKVQVSIDGMFKSFNGHNAWYLLDCLDWLLQVLMRVVMLVVIVFAALLCAKYARQFFASSLNSFEERHIHGFFARLLAVIILCLPFLLGLNIYLVACLYLVLFYPFFENRERLAALLVGLSVLALPLLGRLAENVLQARVDPALRVHLSQFVRGHLPEDLAAFEAGGSKKVSLDLTHLIMGQMQKSEGDLRAAMETFGAIPKHSPWSDYAQINNGNIRFLAREYQDALEAYGQVPESSPVAGLALYNRSVVKSKQGFLEEAESLRSRAMSSDRKLAARVEVEGPGVVFDALPDNSALLTDAILYGSDAQPPFVQRFLPYLALVLAMVLLSLFHLRSRNTRLLTKSCDKCGRLYLPSDSPESEWCSQCVTLYMKKDDLPSEAKLRKHDEVTRFSRRRRLIYGTLQVLAPGSKKLLTGNAVSGLFTLGLWVLMLNLCLTPINGVAHLAMRFLDGPVLLTWIFMAVAVVYWAIFGLRPILKEG